MTREIMSVNRASSIAKRASADGTDLHLEMQQHAALVGADDPAEAAQRHLRRNAAGIPGALEERAACLRASP
jgi:hypothetical protein